MDYSKICCIVLGIIASISLLVMIVGLIIISKSKSSKLVYNFETAMFIAAFTVLLTSVTAAIIFKVGLPIELFLSGFNLVKLIFLFFSIVAMFETAVFIKLRHYGTD